MHRGGQVRHTGGRREKYMCVSMLPQAPPCGYHTPPLQALATTGSGGGCAVCKQVNVNNLQAISELEFGNSGEPGPQADVCAG